MTKPKTVKPGRATIALNEGVAIALGWKWMTNLVRRSGEKFYPVGSKLLVPLDKTTSKSWNGKPAWRRPKKDDPLAPYPYYDVPDFASSDATAFKYLIPWLNSHTKWFKLCGGSEEMAVCCWESEGECDQHVDETFALALCRAVLAVEESGRDQK